VKRLAQSTLLCLSVLEIAGCAAMKERPKNPLKWNAHRDALVEKYSKNDSWYEEYSAAIKANDLAKAKTLRDQTLYDLIWLVNDRYIIFENSLNSDSATIDTATTVTSLRRQPPQLSPTRLEQKVF
jgi:hypothetical protein